MPVALHNLLKSNMEKLLRIISVTLALLLAAAAAPGSNISGTWQGLMHLPGGGTSRRVMVIAKSVDTYSVTIHSLDETDVPIVTKNVTVDGSDVTMKFDMNTDPWLNYHRVYHAHMSQNDSALTGSWAIPGVKPIAVDYRRVAHATWPILVPKASSVQVEPGVQVETLDWGGTGRPLLLLAGAGDTGHRFFGIVAKLTPKYHVYSMTRRGFGNSSTPSLSAKNYSADRLGDDVVAVIDALHMRRPILAGHSIAGEELSDVGSRFPQKVSALIYLDAGYRYAFNSGTTHSSDRPSATDPPLLRALLDGTKIFKGPIPVPILAIYAYPTDFSRLPKTVRRPSNMRKYNAEDDAQIRSFAHGLPNARIVRIANADHYIYISNQDEVVRDMNTFIAGLPK